MWLGVHHLEDKCNSKRNRKVCCRKCELWNYDNAPAYEYYPMVKDVLDRFKIIEEGNECIQDVGIYFRDISISISIGNGYRELTIDEYESISENPNQERGSIFIGRR